MIRKSINSEKGFIIFVILNPSYRLNIFCYYIKYFFFMNKRLKFILFILRSVATNLAKISSISFPIKVCSSSFICYFLFLLFLLLFIRILSLYIVKKNLFWVPYFWRNESNPNKYVTDSSVSIVYYFVNVHQLLKKQ